MMTWKTWSLNLKRKKKDRYNVTAFLFSVILG